MKLGRAAAFAVGTAVVIIGGIWMFQDHFIYFPGPDPGQPPGEWSELAIHTEDGLALTSWIREAPADAAGPVAIVFPGNAGNRAGRVALGDRLAEVGFTVVLAEYRGYGGNPGRPSEEGLVKDADAVVGAVRDAGLTADGVVYFGESLGAAVAVAAAATGDPPEALVLGSPFTSLADVGSHHYSFLPVRTLVGDAYPSLARIERGELADIPTLVIIGSGDRTIPAEQSRTIAGALDAEVYEVAGADHNDPSIRSSRNMVKRVYAFVDSVIGDGERADG